MSINASRPSIVACVCRLRAFVGGSKRRGSQFFVWRLWLSDLGLVSATAAKCSAVQCSALCRGWVDGSCVELTLAGVGRGVLLRWHHDTFESEI